MRLWVALFWLLMGGSAAAQTLTIATTGTFPPFLWEEGETVSGFDIDLMDEICRRNGYDCEYRVYALMPGLEAVARGEADIALGGIGISGEREAFGDFTCPYEAGSISLVPIFATDPDIDLATARIAVLADSLSHRDLVALGYTAVPFPDLAEAITSVLTGQTDAYHGNPNSLSLVTGASDRLVQVGVVESSGTGPAFLVTSSRPRLLAMMNDTLSVLHRDGGLQDIADRWFEPGRYAPPRDMGVACGPIVTATGPATSLSRP